MLLYFLVLGFLQIFTAMKCFFSRITVMTIVECFPESSHCPKHFKSICTHFILRITYVSVTVCILLIIQSSHLRFREVQELAQGLTASKYFVWSSGDFFMVEGLRERLGTALFL